MTRMVVDVADGRLPYGYIPTDYTKCWPHCARLMRKPAQSLQVSADSVSVWRWINHAVVNVKQGVAPPVGGITHVRSNPFRQ